MAISVDFGTCNVDNEVVDKGATGAITWTNQNVSCDWLNTDILNPVLKVQSGKVNCNYVKINSFGGRFYFVESAESYAGTHCILRCHVDVLYTYKSAILGLECLVLRNEDINKWKRDETDSVIPVSNRRVVYGRNMSNTSIVKSTSDEYIVGIM